MADERIIQAIGRCDPDEPLQPQDPRWHNFDDVRHVKLHHNINLLLQGATAEGKYSHIALAGHRGCGKSSELNFDNDETGRFLLFRRAALEYNGERWVGVHPLLWEAPEFQAALQAERQARGQTLNRGA